MKLNVLLPIAKGTEEIEAVVPIDLFRRSGIHVLVVGDSYTVECSNGVKIFPDIKFDMLKIEQDFSAIVLPGGLTAVEKLSQQDILIDILKKHNKFNKLIGAICAAPLILANNDLLPANAKITSHPSVKDKLFKFQHIEDKVVFYKNIITSPGAGTSFDFALAIIEQLRGKQFAQKIAKSILYG